MKTVSYDCEYCKMSRTITLNRWEALVRNGQKPRFCGRGCQGKYIGSDAFKDKFGMTFKQWIRKCREEEAIFWREKILKTRPVISFKDMPPEKQMEMKRLYEHKEVS